EALDGAREIEVSFEEAEIQLPEDIDPYIISLVSSFEQLSIVDPYLIEEKEEEAHHHTHEVGQGEEAQKKITVVFFLNIFFSVAEFIFGALFNSQAILSDAVHDLGD